MFACKRAYGQKDRFLLEKKVSSTPLDDDYVIGVGVHKRLTAQRARKRAHTTMGFGSIKFCLYFHGGTQ
jgi:hypothetical protein